MGVSCGVKCAKGLLITFNIFFWVSGCALLGTGIYFLIEKENSTMSNLFALPEDKFSYGEYLALAVLGIGALVFLVGFCGCCGAVRESRSLLAMYFIFLFIIMAAELAVGILSVIFQDKMLLSLEELPSILKEEYGIVSTTTEAFDFAQTRFNCCGVYGPGDYTESEWKMKDLGKGDEVSRTCCLLLNRDHMHPIPLNSSWCQSAKEEENLHFRHQQGCVSKLEEFAKRSSILLVSLGCGIASLQILGMIFAICLCKEV